MPTLGSQLNYEPRELGFGTSGRRGLVRDLTQLEIYINVTGEVRYLQSLTVEAGGIVRGEEFYFARDLRPSSHAITQAVVRAIEDCGMRPVNLGCIPTPALAYYALGRRRASIMVTGSHIPFDRNGYKLNTTRGELMKTQEAPINQAVRAVRELVYAQPVAESPFEAHGALREPPPMPPEEDAGRSAYLERYLGWFGNATLGGGRVAVYQHSAVGRDLLVDALRLLGADVVAAGRSEEFVPIDTENISREQLEQIQKLADAVGPVEAVVSTDGDSDRPLVLAVDSASRRVRFIAGDLLGMIVAAYLNADSVVVPISTNDAIDRGPLARVLEPKTKIGSPYVIAGMEQARAKGRRAVVGWEANGGFLTGSDIARAGAVLTALPTRDAFLPILCVLCAAHEMNAPLAALLDRLPKRFGRSALLKQFPRERGLELVERLKQASPEDLQGYFGFGPVAATDQTDGLRITFASGDVAHVRPSGNADELRIYAVADSQQRADEIAERAVAEPDGILRRLEESLL